mmetsp:Transcript_9214/g.19986  ORF Transcript_9214/g.19986 Transcript_9214/m.19986 type:complete len:105 (+) Transcript_9214:394-708(+)
MHRHRGRLVDDGKREMGRGATPRTTGVRPDARRADRAPSSSGRLPPVVSASAPLPAVLRSDLYTLSASIGFDSVVYETEDGSRRRRPQSGGCFLLWAARLAVVR